MMYVVRQSNGDVTFYTIVHVMMYVLRQSDGEDGGEEEARKEDPERPSMPEKGWCWKYVYGVS